MKIAAALIAALSLGACSGDGSYTSPTSPPALRPPSPPPPAPAPTSIWLSGMVFPAGNSPLCIEGARVEVVRGEGLGRSQVQGACNYWWEPGFAFGNLKPGGTMVLRVSAKGYVTKKVFVALPTDRDPPRLDIELVPSD